MSKAVNKPTDPKLRDQDIEKKLQLYGIVTAFGLGKVPTNQQIDVALNSATAWEPMKNPPKSLSQDGQQLVRDLRAVIEQAKVLLLSKNEGNLIQDFTWQTRHIGQGDANGVKAPIDKDTADKHGREALEGLRTLGELLITNGQFRKLLNDATILLRDIAGDAAQKSADKVNPSEEELRGIDDAAPDHTWHEKPDLSRENLKQQVQSRVPVGQETVRQAVGDATQAAHPSGTRDPAQAASRDQQAGTTSGADPRTGALEGKETIRQNMDDEQERKLREKKERAREYYEKKMPKERREQVIWRLRKIVVECQGHREYQQAIESLLRLAEEYQGHAENLGQQSKGAVQGGRNQGPVQQAENDLKTVLERFANGTSFDDAIDSINQIYRDADRDPELRNWFKQVDTYIRKCLQQQGFILEDRATEEYNQLYEQGRILLREKYKSHTDRIIDEFEYVGKQFDRDAQNKAFAQSLEKLFHDLGHDSSTGNPTFKPHLVEDLGNVILPGFFQTVGYIPVPRIEYSDTMIDAVVENLILEGDNLFPNIFEFGSDNYWRWTRRTPTQGNANKNKVMMSVTGIQADIRDVAYYIKKKEGFPSVTDKGVLDIFFGGSGISFKVAMETADKSDNAHFFKIQNVVIDIDDMNINLKQSNHKLLFKLFKPLLLKVIRPVVQKVLEKQIRDNVHKFDGICFEAKKEADRAKEQAKNSPNPEEETKSLYQYYYNAFQNQLSRAQNKKEEAVGDKQANVAITQHDSIFKNIQLPGGFSTKATKYNDMARSGEKWTSPVFGLGSAPESRNIPSTKVSRRSGKALEESSRGTRNPDVAVPGSQTAHWIDEKPKQGTLDPGRPNAPGDYWVQTKGATGTTAADAGLPGTGPTGGSQTANLTHNFNPPREGGGQHTTLGQHNPLLEDWDSGKNP